MAGSASSEVDHARIAMMGGVGDVQTIECAGCGEQLWEGDWNTVPEAMISQDVAQRTPCANCGSTARHHSRRLVEQLSAVASLVKSEVTRATNSDRLTVFTFLVSIGVGVGLTVGFAAGSAIAGLLSALGSMVATVLLVRVALHHEPSRDRIMALMHWMTGR